MIIKQWEKESAVGVIKQIKKAIKLSGELPDCWKSYLRNMNRHMLEIMKFLDTEFMDSILETI